MLVDTAFNDLKMAVSLGTFHYRLLLYWPKEEGRGRGGNEPKAKAGKKEGKHAVRGRSMAKGDARERVWSFHGSLLQNTGLICDRMAIKLLCVIFGLLLSNSCCPLADMVGQQ